MKFLQKLAAAGAAAVLAVSLAIPASARCCRADRPYCGGRNGGYSCGVIAAANVLGQTAQETAAQLRQGNTCPMVMLDQQGKREEFQAERARMREECAADCPQGGEYSSGGICNGNGSGVCGTGSGQGAGLGYGCGRGRGYGGGHHGNHHGGRHC